MDSHTDSEMISGKRGTLRLEPGTHAVGTIPRFKSFRASTTGVTVSALKCVSQPGDADASEADCLTDQIRGSSGLEPTELHICRKAVFTSITFAGGNIVLNL